MAYHNSGRLIQKPLRRRDWLGIILMLIPIILYILFAFYDIGPDKGEFAPRNDWNLGQMVALILLLPLWTIAIALFLSGQVKLQERGPGPVRRPG